MAFRRAVRHAWYRQRAAFSISSGNVLNNSQVKPKMSNHLQIRQEKVRPFKIN